MDEEKSPITLDSNVAQKKDLITSPLAGEMVLLNLDTVTYHGLDEVATHIWELLSRPRRVADLVDELLVDFDIDRATCEAETLELLAQMHQQEVIVVRDA